MMCNTCHRLRAAWYATAPLIDPDSDKNGWPRVFTVLRQDTDYQAALEAYRAQVKECLG